MIRKFAIVLGLFLMTLSLSLVSCGKEEDPAGDNEICNDGIDNDADGFIDCDDLDCTGSPDC